MKLLINADDYGLSKNNIDIIVDLIKTTPLNSLSIITNTSFFDYAIKKLDNIKIDSLGIHINLTDGYPTLSKLKYIVNKKNMFKYNYLDFILLHKKKNFNLIKKEIEEEILNQVIKVLERISHKNYFIKLDSHQHIHSIPWLFEIFTKIMKKTGIKAIRFPKEKIFNNSTYLKFLKPQIFINNLKRLLIDSQLKKINIKKEYEITDFFCGILYSGITFKKELIESINISKNNNHKLAEIILHPGYINSKEHKNIKNSFKYFKFIVSKNREKEASALRNLLKEL